MRTYSAQDIESLPQRFRAAFVNSISGFKSASLIGTIDTEGNHNLSIVSSVVHLGSNPALLGFIMRPPVVPRDSYENILETGVYTINHVGVEHVKQAHQTSARYPREVSEFEAVGLTAGCKTDFLAPYVEEASVRIGMRFVREVPIEENNTRLMIGRVAWVDFEGKGLNDDGYLDLEVLGTATISGLDSYHATKRLARYSYAKPETLPREID